MTSETAQAELTQAEATQFDYGVFVDISGSMSMEDEKIGSSPASRYDASRETTENLARFTGKYDADGVTLGFFNDKSTLYKNTTSDKMSEVFSKHSPTGSTNTAASIRDAWNTHKNTGKKFLGFWITDGEPSNKQEVEQVITEISNSLKDASEFRIAFVQAGHAPEATRWLESVDNGSFGKYDIVNTMTLSWLNEHGPAAAILRNIRDSH